jgi:hypothetical protein
MKNTSFLQTITNTTAVLAFAGSTLVVTAQTNNWQDNAISPVGNPIFFEDPRITSEVRPIFMQHWLPDTFHFYNDGGAGVPLGGSVRVYAVQLRYALTERLGLIATKDGYIEMQPDHTVPHSYGWGDLSAGLKYALVDNRERELLLTPGFTFSIPTGSRTVNQGRGWGEWNLFVSGEKGFGKFHVTGNFGARIPDDFSDQTAQLHYSLQADYFLHRYFIPFVELNGYTVLSDGKNKLLGAVDLNTEMYDLINFGSTKASGSTQLTIGGGIRSKLTKSLDFGVAYEAGVVDPVGIFSSRVTVDLVWRFK